ncbi:MAG: hypothetical protein WDO13_08955 [Verrucomicrobiota bacterium]
MNAVKRFFRSRTLWGLLGTAAVMYLVLFVVLGRLNVGWMMPDTKQIARTLVDAWPRLPFFAQKEKTPQGDVIYYTVPTHQMTPQELRDMGLTNAAPRPAKP